MRWTIEEYANYQARRAAQGSKPESIVRDESVAEKEGEDRNTAFFPCRVVRISSYRKRLLDPDNLAGGCKYVLDCCKYSQLINDDRPQAILLEVRQFKVKTTEEERTEIEISPAATTGG